MTIVQLAAELGDLLVFLDVSLQLQRHPLELVVGERLRFLQDSARVNK